MATAPRVLFFSPYAAWTYHTALEATWGHALAARGVDVRFVLCDGLSGACDIYRENINPRQPISCLECQAKTASTMHELATPYAWLGTYLDPRVEHEALDFVARLPRHRLLEAEWDGLPIGAWCSASAHTQFRAARLEVLDPKVETAVREFLLGTIKVARATETLYEVERPDTVALLNGRFFAHWAAIELAERRGIRWITHERGLQKDTIRFARGARLHDLVTNERIWDEWGAVPLSAEELERTAQILDERRHGQNYSRLVFSPPQQDATEVRARLQLDDRPLVAVFNSSDDETAAFPERRAGAFPEPRDFLPAVVELARRRADLQFAIRLHPNIAKARAGKNDDALAHGLAIAASAPSNVRVVQPADEISSYSLVDLASAVMVYGSTIGLEAAGAGKPVLCMARSTYSHTGCALQVDRPEELEPALERALDRTPAAEAGRERTRRALRWTYRYFREYSIPFDLVAEQGDCGASLTYTDLEELLPGRHQALDAACDLLSGATSSFFPPPSAEERARATEAEEAFLARVGLERVRSALTAAPPAATRGRLAR